MAAGCSSCYDQRVTGIGELQVRVRFLCGGVGCVPGERDIEPGVHADVVGALDQRAPVLVRLAVGLEGDGGC